MELDSVGALSDQLHSDENIINRGFVGCCKKVDFYLDKTSVKVEDFEVGGKVLFSSPAKTIELDVHSCP